MLMWCVFIFFEYYFYELIYFSFLIVFFCLTQYNNVIII